MFKTLLGNEKVHDAASALGRVMTATELLMRTSGQVCFVDILVYFATVCDSLVVLSNKVFAYLMFCP